MRELFRGEHWSLRSHPFALGQLCKDVLNEGRVGSSLSVNCYMQCTNAELYQAAGAHFPLRKMDCILVDDP
ncbi:hypothetical protein NEOLEDRAFT_1130021 [Neolentinus lepideus HHB14362 ss-1]|uniref:Uncharacterized protein n=1 Tax=Neolentinus lepideus HHB14362 ss-1 TaxID=1314782 RepID=A0A165UFB9_9AGAM|nr:hypothetical protein NEOLEDRAFT_1130021 [Neolentinus lepideus HHB14362 ss-1]